MRRLFVLASLLVATPAHAEWWEARTEHFIIYSQDDEQETRAFAAELERFDHSLRVMQNKQFTPIKSDSQRVTIYRTGDVEDIGRLAHTSGAAGFYKPQLYPVAFTPVRDRDRGGHITRGDSRTDLNPKSVLFHEYAHHFMFQYFPAAYPSWYVEAFAETAATIDMKADGSFHLGNPPNWRTSALFGGMLTVTPQSLLASTAKPDGEDHYGYYSVGWLMNHYLTFEPSRRGQLQTYLRLVNTGMDSAPAARQAFGDLGKLGGEIGRYKNSRRLGGVDIRPDTKPSDRIVMRKLTEDEEAVMRVKIRSKAGVTRSETSSVAADARAISRKYPNSFAANLAQAEAEFDAENYEAAGAAADRALQLRPNSVEALVAKGAVLLERGKKDKQYLVPARISLAKAYELDPADPAPLFLNYLTYHYSGQAIPESAIIGLEYSYQAARQDTGVRLVLGRQLLAEKKGPLAKEILLPLGLDPHESKRKKKIREVIGMIDAGKVADAHTKLAQNMIEAEEKAKKGD